MVQGTLESIEEAVEEVEAVVVMDLVGLEGKLLNFPNILSIANLIIDSISVQDRPKDESVELTLRAA